MTQSHRVANTYEVHGLCNYADNTGDQVFEELTTNAPATIGSPVVLKGKWLGVQARRFEREIRNTSRRDFGIVDLTSCWPTT